MKVHEQLDEDLIDLGAVTTETRGNDVLGPLDHQTGLRIWFGGILADD